MKKANNICCLFFLKKLKIGTQYNEYGIQITIIASIPGINYKKGRNKKITDKDILNSLPANNPAWWCKVENGYILNLLGQKKNKIPYDYST